MPGASLRGKPWLRAGAHCTCTEWQQSHCQLEFISRQPYAVWAVVFNKSQTTQPEVVPLMMTIQGPLTLKTARAPDEGGPLSCLTCRLEPSSHTGQQAAQQTETTTLGHVPGSFPPCHCPPTLRRFVRRQSLSPFAHNWRGGASRSGTSPHTRRRGRVMSVRALAPRRPRADDCHHHTVLGGCEKGARDDETTMRGGWRSVVRGPVR